MPHRPFSFVSRQVGPKEGGDAHQEQVQGSQQGGLEGVAVFVGEEVRLSFQPKPSGDKDEHAQRNAAPISVVEGGHGAAHPLAGAATVLDRHGKAHQGLGQAPGPLPQPICRYLPSVHIRIISWRAFAVKKA